MKVEITWTPILEALPDAEKAVLGSISGGSAPTWFVFTDGSEWFDACTWEAIDGRVTHWSELPMGVEP